MILEPNDTRPLVQQIFAALALQIVSQEVLPGTRLPASRNLAEELGVSRSTVVAAYEQLSAEGYARSQPGSGHYVCDVGDAGSLYALSQPQPTLKSEPQQLAHSAHPLPFVPGVPDMRLFPHAAWAKHVTKTARKSAESLLGTGERFGLRHLRAAIATHLATWRGIDVSARQIVITAGAGDALEMALRVLTRERRAVALENPTYPPLFRIATNMGLKMLWLAVGTDGAELPAEAAKPQVTVLTPSYQFPLGGAMPRNQRLAFLERAERDNSWIIEDDFDSEFRYAGRPIPALASLDRNQRVIYVGSFSKIFSSGLRIGYMVAPISLVPAFEEALGHYGQRASLAPQWPIASFIEDGSFHRHIRRMRRIYGERRHAFVEMLRCNLPPPVYFDDHRAGMQIALRFPEHWNDKLLSDRALREGIFCPPLSAFYPEGRAQSGLLTGFAAFAPEEVREPLRNLTALIERYGRDHSG
jgi:GntR family transcriptional regulator/MocR family aminotransferase